MNQQRQGRNNFPCLTTRGVSFEPIVTHRYSIDDAEEAYRVADESHAGKVVFTWE